MLGREEGREDERTFRHVLTVPISGSLSRPEAKRPPTEFRHSEGEN
jgi:hypothetical protein